MEDMNEREEKF
jgi:ribonucleases P/MRP protein subunit RPP40